MKKLIIILCISFFGITHIDAQHQICGNDTVILKLTNFQYGTIRWEESTDSFHWSTIPNEVDTFYKFYPEKSKYYRGVGITAYCPPTYSDITLVTMPVKANAGIDRILTGTKVYLAGNLLKGTTGLWSILSGTGGTLTFDKDPYTELTGIKSSSYKLLWSLTNICGSYYDTVNIEFKENVYRNTYVIVDSTDNLLSDSIQRVNGAYNIIFANPVPTITDSTVLIGIIGEGFIRKVVSFIIKADTFFIQTKQALISDFILNGALNFAPGLYPNTILKRSGNLNGLSTGKYPTRKEILSNVYKDGQIIYEGTIINNIEKGVCINNDKRVGYDPKEMRISISDCPVFEDNGASITLASGSINIQPNIVSDLEVGGLKLKKFNMGLNNAKIAYTLAPKINCSASFSLSDYSKTLLSYKNILVIMAGAVPIVITADIDLNATLNIDANGAINVSAKITKSDIVSAGIRYNTGIKDFENYFEKSENLVFDNNFDITDNIKQSLSVGPEIKVKLFGLSGGYFDLEILKESLNLGINSQVNWGGGCDISTDITVGVTGEIELTPDIKKELFKASANWPLGCNKFILPYELTLISGDQQKGDTQQNLPKPIIVQVKGSGGIPTPFVRVCFETNYGMASVYSILTDSQGYAQVNWELADTTGPQILTVSVFDGDQIPLINAPLILFSGKTGDSTYNGEKSTLSLKIKTLGNEISPEGIGGCPPYEYSRDGLVFSSFIKDVIQPGKTYTYFVKDSTGCASSKSYTSPINNCLNSSLVLNLTTSARNIIAQASGGLPPYQFSMTDVNHFSSNNLFTNLANGDYKVFVKDMIGCLNSATVNINTPDAKPTVKTGYITNVTNVSATFEGNDIKSQGSSAVYSKGVCWSQFNKLPSLMTDHVVPAGSGAGRFTCNLTGLAPTIKYYVRAFAFNLTTPGEAYGDTVSFTTDTGFIPMKPSVTISEITNIKALSASSGGNVQYEGSSPVKERGICWDTLPYPDINKCHHTHDGTGPGNFTSNITGLKSNTTYFFVAYAINSKDTGQSKIEMKAVFDEVGDEMDGGIIYQKEIKDGKTYYSIVSKKNVPRGNWKVANYPTRNQLEVLYGLKKNTLNTKNIPDFEDFELDGYWSKEESGSKNAFVVNFKTGNREINPQPKTNNCYGRLVWMKVK